MTSQRPRTQTFAEKCNVYYQCVKYIVCTPCQRKIELLDPQEVLRNRLGDDLEVLSFTTEPLVKSGDNYGSTIIKVTVEVKIRSRKETLHLVAKMLPAFPFLRKVYECDFTVAKEIFLYEQIMPAYERLCGEKLDIVPEFYGGRLATKPGEMLVDEGAVILLENLKESGYTMEVRQEGLSMNHVRHVIAATAKFHAIGLAIKHKSPEFYAAIQNYAKPLEMTVDVMGNVIPEQLKLIKNSSQLRKYHERVSQLTNRTREKMNCLMQFELDPDDPWACLVHRDLWKNNIMFHIEEGQINGLKFFDFQNYCLSSPMTDIMYFLCTSMHRDNFEHYFDQTVELYRTTVSGMLVELDCDASMFEKESFDRKLAEDARSEIFHAILTAAAVEMQSMWEVIKPVMNENLICRCRRILEVYDRKGWF